MCGHTNCGEPGSAGPTIATSIYTDQQKWIHYTDGSVELVGSTKTVTPGYKTGMHVKPNMPVKNYSNDYHDLTAVYWLQYKNFFSSPFPAEHKFLCRQYSKQRMVILSLTRQVDELRAEVEEIRAAKHLEMTMAEQQSESAGYAALGILGVLLLMLLGHLFFGRSATTNIGR